MTVLRLLVVIALLATIALAAWFGLSERGPQGDAPHVAGSDDEPEDPILIGSGHGQPADAPDEAAAPTSTVAPNTPDPTTGYTVVGVVLDAGGEPFPRVGMVIRPTDERERRIQTGADGRFVASALPPGPCTVVVKAVLRGKDKPHRAKVVTFEAEDEPDLTLQLELFPYVDIVVVDSETGDAPRTTLIEVIYEDDGEASVRSTSSWSRMPEGGMKPFRHRFANTWPKIKTRIRFRVQGYESSPWIDAPTVPEDEPLRIELDPDPSSVAQLVLVVSTDTGEQLEAVMTWSGGGGSPQDIVGGELELELGPGKHTITLGSHEEKPFRAWHWFVPQQFDVELDRGELRRIDVMLEKGGFVSLPISEDQGMATLRFAKDDEAVELSVWRGELAGPLAPGTWTYADEDETFGGTVDVVAGEVVKTTPTPIEKKGADDDG